jgi:ADP-heptose:LPS heptosyltransferase
MKHRSKILVDRLLGTPLAVLLAGAARTLGEVRRRIPARGGPPRCVAFAKFEGMGSMLHAAPLCAAARRAYPEARIVFVTSAGNAAFARRLPEVDEVIALDERSFARAVASSARLVARFWGLRPDLYFDLELYSSTAAILATFSLARRRLGFYRKSATFKKGLHTQTVFFNTARHISDAYREILRAAGIEPLEQDLGPVTVTEPDREEARRFLDESGIGADAPFLAVNANASDLLLERRWPREKWIAFLGELLRDRPEPVVLTGAPGERAWVEGLRDSLPPSLRARATSAAGRLGLGGFLALLQRSRLLITSDSGPLHFAVALGTPTVSLWGPGEPRHYAPRDTTNHRVVYRAVYCSPCLYHADVPPCGGDNICMKGIGTDEVRQAVHELLGRRQADASA